MIAVTLKCGEKVLNNLLSTYKVQKEQSWGRVITTLGGKEAAAGAKYRTVVTFSFMPLSDSQSAEVYTALKTGQVGPWTFTDPDKGQDVTDTMRLASGFENAFGIKSSNGNRYYKGGEITIRQVQAE